MSFSILLYTKNIELIYQTQEVVRSTLYRYLGKYDGR